VYAGFHSFPRALLGGDVPAPDPPEDSEAELTLLRDARLAAIPSDWGHYAGACATAHLLIAVADDQCVERALSVAAGDSHYLATSPWS
jgi:hypothetical protein